MTDGAKLACFDDRLAVPGQAGLVCFDEGLRLPLDFSGSPAMDRAVCRFVAEHVYHDIHLLGAPPSGPFITVGADTPDAPTMSAYAAGTWPQPT
ncbi:hypothetical protein [Dactylosporangium sp. NPDC051484]|uniref:hypothetical protein n=1 Tax=Dactylosporangium sp. NPDC051484 TaxID=3154942 RepID=UPI0034504B9D